MERYIYVISTQHLEHILYEFQNMESTRMVGYGNPKDALRGLLELNTSQIYGFIIVDYEISDEDRGMYAKFIRQIDRICKKDTLLMVGLNEVDNLGKVINVVKPKNIKVQLFQYDVLTDFNIRRELIGPILLKEERPYVPRKIEVWDPAVYKAPTFGVPQTFSREFFNAVSELSWYSNVNEAIESDTVLASFDPKSVWYKFRRYVIYKKLTNNSYGFNLEEYREELSVDDYCAIREYIRGGE